MALITGSIGTPMSGSARVDSMESGGIQGVGDPVIESFTASDLTVTVGTSTLLTAIFSGGTGTVDNGVGTVVGGIGVMVAPISTTTYTLSVTSELGVSITQAVTVTVIAQPDATLVAPSNALPGAVGLVASVPTQAGATYTWTIVGGIITAGQGTGQITFSVGQAGSVQIQCIVTNSVGVAAIGTSVLTIIIPEISGYYTTDHWDVLLYQNGSVLEGDWYTDTSGWGKHFKLKGTLVGYHAVLTFYTDATPNGDGTFDITFTPDALTFKGNNSGYGTGENFHGTRKSGVYMKLSPTAAQIARPGAQIQYTAAVAGSPNKAMTWSATAGTVDSTGNYTVPSGVDYTVQTVTATSVASPTVKVSAQVSVTPTGIIEVSGYYTTDHWDVLLYQNGSVLEGDWYTDTSGWGKHFKLKGTLVGYHAVLTFYTDATPNGDGTFDITFTPDALTFKGNNSGYGTGENFHGTRKSGVYMKLSPTAAQIARPGAQIQYTAAVAGSPNKAMTWSATAGTVDSTGNYTVPSGVDYTVQTVTAASVASPTVKVSAQVSVTPTGIIDIAGLYSTSAYDLLLYQDGNSILGDWFTDNGGWAQHFFVKGTLNGYKLLLTYYNVGNPNGAGTMNLTFAADGKTFTGVHSYYGTWNGTRKAGNFVQLVPLTTTVSKQSDFTFRVLYAPAIPQPTVWTIKEGFVGGTVTADGVYTAPANAGIYHVSVALASEATKVSTATVTVPPSDPLKVTIAPTQVSMDKMTTQPFAAVVTGSADTGVMWSASDGQIDPVGNYTAPDRYGTFTVTASAHADPVVRDEATVVVPGGTPSGTFAYDPNGNLTSDGQRTFEWDAENRLVAVTITATGHRSEFGYDGLGRRVEIIEKDPDATQTLQVTSDKKYLWDGVEIAEERDATGGIVQKRFYSQGFVDTDGTILFYTRDHLGSIRELTDSTQAVRARYDYDPYGRMTKVQGDKDSMFTYTGHFWHAQSGLNLAVFRAYDPNTGRWISRDPVGIADGTNLYSYVKNNTLNLSDPLGDIGIPFQQPRDSKKCDDTYKCRDNYMGANARCFCKCADNGPWSSMVRSILMDLYRNNVSMEAAHIASYAAATAAFGPLSIPVPVLAACFFICRQVQQSL
jgi:RHS repeat-associated protein